jgi:hypothetical protein
VASVSTSPGVVGELIGRHHRLDLAAGEDRVQPPVAVADDPVVVLEARPSALAVDRVQKRVDQQVARKS